MAELVLNVCFPFCSFCCHGY